ncbi:3-oxoadipate enol-lactonase [Nocardia sp. NPDC050793]|uniref:3-oxoadipate enol-lactonase n=1 Tax=Nocardia sp. NPDC050793 TaxID=3155159 RepID=UPI0033F57638
MNTVPVHVLDEGPADGPAMVLSGSLGSDLRMWDPQVPALLRAGFRVVRYDHRGHGSSPVPTGPYSLADLGGDVLAMLNRVGVRQAHFVGLSLGGMVGMWLAQHAAERLRTLTLCCTSVDLGQTGSYGSRARLVRAEGTAGVAAGVVQRWFTPQWHNTHPDHIDFYENMVAATPAEGYAACCEAIETMDIATGLSAIDVPVLVVAGENDQATPPAHGSRIADAVGHGRLHVVRPAAHLANVEQSEALTALIIRHASMQSAETP